MGIASAAEYQMIIFDTPGIIENKRTKLEERMMAAVVSSIQVGVALLLENALIRRRQRQSAP